jgi:sigma-B regulation protein RsbU (phosphoserine phosphatase)
MKNTMFSAATVQARHNPARGLFSGHQPSEKPDGYRDHVARGAIPAISGSPEPTMHVCPSLSHPALQTRLTVDDDAWRLARRVHRSLLPDHLRDERVDVVVHYEEHEMLGGDYCSVFKRSDDHLFLCVYDVTGHGLPSALLAGRISSFVQHEITVAHHPCEVVDTLNRFVAGHFDGLGIYATFLCVEIDLGQRSIVYAGAGHPPALLQRCDGTFEPLGSLSPLIGVLPEMGRNCRDSKTGFAPGDRLLLFTDGLIETRNAYGEMLGIDGVTAVLRDIDGQTGSDEIVAELATARRRFAGYDIPDDDMLLLVTSFIQ